MQQAKPENMIRFLKDDKTSEWFQEDRKSFYKAVKNAEQNRLEKTRIRQKRALQSESGPLHL